MFKLSIVLITIFSTLIVLCSAQSEYITLSPFSDNQCTTPGGAIGISFENNVTEVRIMNPYPEFDDYILLCANFTMESEGYNAVFSACNGKAISEQLFPIGSCIYSKQLDGYYKLSTEYPKLSKGTLIGKVWLTGSHFEECSIEQTGFFNFIYNGTILNVLNEGKKLQQQYTCKNGKPFSTDCMGEHYCKTYPYVVGLCDDADFLVTCL